MWLSQCIYSVSSGIARSCGRSIPRFLRNPHTVLHSNYNTLSSHQQCSRVRFSPFHTVHTVHGVLKARILKWFAIPFSSGPRFVRALHHDPSVLGDPTWHGETRLWFMWSDWLVFCDCGFQSIWPLTEKDKRLLEASWRERLTEVETGSCSDRWGHAQ